MQNMASSSFFLLLLFLISLIQYGHCSSNCIDVSQEGEFPKNRMGTKTTYANAEKDTSLMPEFTEEVRNCTEVKVWLFCRHGTRYPIYEDLDKLNLLPQLKEEIVQNSKDGRGCLSEKESSKFEDWTIPYSPEDYELLHSLGAEELNHIGNSWRNRLATIFGQSYSETRFKVQSTAFNRTSESAYNFLKGAFGDDISRNDIPEPYSPNLVLTYDDCVLWNETVHFNPATYEEQRLFEKSEVFVTVSQEVSSRLGFNYTLSANQLLAIFFECRYETAWREERSIWCIPFTSENVEVLEYHEDMKFYYVDGPGSQLSLDIACVTLLDLYTKLKENVNSNEADPKGVLYFSHDDDLIKTLGRLGYFQTDEPLTHDWFQDSRNRKFRTSVMSPFGANLALVLYKCDNEHKVGFFLNESPIKIKHVCEGVLCSWKDWEALLEPVSQNCDVSEYEEVCSSGDPSGKLVFLHFGKIIFFLLLILCCV